MSWSDFDELARGVIRPSAVRRLRSAERSRRLVLLRALVDEVTKNPDLSGPLPSPDEAWDLLARVDARVPAAFDLVLAHPYVGSWAGYTIRLLHRGITGICPLWAHVGNLHAIAAAAAIRAGLHFRIAVPVWEGGAILPTLGLVRLPTDEAHSVAELRGSGGRLEITHKDSRVVLSNVFDADTPHWWCVRQVEASAGPHRLPVRLDDVDPYRGLHEPLLPRRLGKDEVGAWRTLMTEAWRLLVKHVPDLAGAMSCSMESIVPSPAVRFRSASASTGEAFGSALIARPDDSAALAATLVHEFQHIVLGGVLHLTGLHEDDPSERFYVPWRPDPRPLSGALQGVYAFFGVAAFWRAIARADTGPHTRRAMFEFALARSQAWRVLRAIRDDARLTPAGRRFVDGIATTLEPWQNEPVPDDVRLLADAVTDGHYAGWRMRHLRPDRHTVAVLTEAWLAGRAHPPATTTSCDPLPTPVQDGSPSEARGILIGLSIVADHRELTSAWPSVSDATIADLAYATGRFADAAQGYRTELAQDPERVPSWIGLGLALSALGTSPAARALTRCPELVRAVRRRICSRSAEKPTPEQLAAWLGQVMH